MRRCKLKSEVAIPAKKMNDSRFQLFLREVWKNRMVYTLVLPGLVWLFLFAYLPMGGLSLAFKDFKANLEFGAAHGADSRISPMCSVTQLLLTPYGER